MSRAGRADIVSPLPEPGRNGSSAGMRRSASRASVIVAATIRLGQLRQNLWRHRAIRVVVLLAIAAFITFDMVFWGPGLYIRQVLYGNGWS